MMDLLEKIATRWISRRADPRPDALTAVKDLTPAIVITGGSSGIGLALAREFAKRASALVLIARTQSRLDHAAASLATEFPGLRIETLCLDVGDPTAIDRLAAWLAERRLYCDVLVNNAAVGQSGPFSAAAPEKLDTMIATNVAAVARLTRAMLPGMLARGRGGILSISSLGGLIPGPHQASYYASKAFVVSLSEAIRAEVAGRGVRIAVVLPGPVETRFHARMDAEGALYRHFLKAARPERVAALAVRGYRLGRSVIAPGILPALAVPVLRILPHAITVPVVCWLLDTGRPALPEPKREI
jgi:short-subunit dehydrogenase